MFINFLAGHNYRCVASARLLWEQLRVEYGCDDYPSPMLVRNMLSCLCTPSPTAPHMSAHTIFNKNLCVHMSCLLFITLHVHAAASSLMGHVVGCQSGRIVGLAHFLWTGRHDHKRERFQALAAYLKDFDGMCVVIEMYLPFILTVEKSIYPLAKLT